MVEKANQKPLNLSHERNNEHKTKHRNISVKWTVLAHLESQPRGQNFQTQNLVDRSGPLYTRPNKILINTFKIN